MKVVEHEPTPSIVGVGTIKWAATSSIAILLAFLAACGGETNGGPSTTPDSGSQCSWPASLDASADAEPRAGRFLLVCQYSVDGGNEHAPFQGSAICITDATMCPVASMFADAQCVDWCKADEYAAVADGALEQTPDGGTALAPPSTLSASCRHYQVEDNGFPYWCCPCE